jgi:type III pantothenate kinase
MNIAVDFGNTIAKVAIFREGALQDKHFFPDSASLQVYLQRSPAENIIVSSVSFPATEILSWAPVTEKKIILSHTLSLPVKLKYKTPETLGVDRIAAVCGALEIYPNQNCLIIDAGTCITFDLLDRERNYWGGAISPGISMRFEAMHKFTAKLPLVKAIGEPPLVGDNTESCLQSGVINGAKAEIEGIILKYRQQFPDIRVILCGGDASLFENLSNQSIFAAPELVLTGLNRILDHLK